MNSFDTRLLGQCGWLLAVLRFVAGDEGFGSFRVALEALGFGHVVLFAPVTLFFKAGDQARITPRAFFFRDAVFAAPPFAVSVSAFAVLVIVMYLVVIVVVRVRDGGAVRV